MKVSPLHKGFGFNANCSTLVICASLPAGLLSSLDINEIRHSGEACGQFSKAAVEKWIIGEQKRGTMRLEARVTLLWDKNRLLQVFKPCRLCQGAIISLTYKWEEGPALRKPNKAVCVKPISRLDAFTFRTIFSKRIWTNQGIWSKYDSATINCQYINQHHQTLGRNVTILFYIYQLHTAKHTEIK